MTSPIAMNTPSLSIVWGRGTTLPQPWKPSICPPWTLLSLSGVHNYTELCVIVPSLLVIVYHIWRCFQNKMHALFRFVYFSTLYKYNTLSSAIPFVGWTLFSLESFMLLCLALINFVFSLWCLVFYQVNGSQFIYLLFCCQTFGWFPVFCCSKLYCFEHSCFWMFLDVHMQEFL